MSTLHEDLQELATLCEAGESCPPDQIVKIISVRDTREYEEVADGVFKPVRGSGTESFCARCGRAHEVHAEVELENGRHAIVGTGCMKGSRLEKEAKTAASAAKAVAKLEAHLKHLQERHGEFKKAFGKVQSMQPPPITHAGGERGQMWLYMGDAKQAYFRPGDEQNARNDVLRLWQAKRMGELGFTMRDQRLWQDIKETEKALDKKKDALKRATAKRV